MKQVEHSDDYRFDTLNDDKHQELSNSQARSLAYTESLTSEPPSCPECNKVLSQRDQSKCGYCGFHYGYLRKIFPPDLPTLDRINDFAGKLSERETKSLEKTLTKIKKQYPQILVKLVILPLQSNVEIQQMALWMLNECPIPEGEEDQDRLWTTLLLIDTTSKASCYANGYKIEVFWTRSACMDSIDNLNYALKKNPLYEALDVTLHSILANLDHSKYMVKKQFRRFKKKFF